MAEAEQWPFGRVSAKNRTADIEKQVNGLLGGEQISLTRSKEKAQFEVEQVEAKIKEAAYPVRVIGNTWVICESAREAESRQAAVAEGELSLPYSSFVIVLTPDEICLPGGCYMYGPRFEALQNFLRWLVTIYPDVCSSNEFGTRYSSEVLAAI